MKVRNFSARAAALLFCAAPLLAGNIVVNGDFEGGTYVDGTTGNILPTGWWLGPPAPSNLSNLNVMSNLTPFGAESGTHFMGYASTANNGTYDCLYQDLTTVAGDTYSISFWVAITAPAASNTNLFGVWDENHTNVQLTDPYYSFPSNAAAEGYKQFTFTETASSNATRIDFHGTDSSGVIQLDNVVITDTTSAAPEPLSMGLTGLGLGLVLVGLVRKRKRAVS
jgi:hypothetical protein